MSNNISMKDTSLAHAKINLSLDIVSKRKDGYHDIISVMQTVGLSDEISVECSEETGDGHHSCVKVFTDLSFLPKDERNTAHKAALAFFDYAGIKGYSAIINIKKNIPVCAGLGGGSADGACVLRMLDKMFKTKIERGSLEALANTIGSDMPFCINGGTKLAKGRGEQLTDIQSIPHCHVVICKPPFSFSTPELFKHIRCEKIRARPDTDGLIGALEKGDLSALARRMFNVFEDVIPRGKSDIENIKSTMLDYGAIGSVMTGSGPSVFGLFENRGNAKNAYSRLKETYPESYLTETC